MKKLLLLAAVAATTSLASGCSFGDKLYILNWQEYISEDLVEEFEQEYGVKVVSKELISNELMYSELDRGVSYDVVFPSDYMIEKLSDEGMLQEIDFSLLTNFEEEMYTNGLNTLIENSGYDEYFVPYFWGSLGIMYNTKDADVKSVVEQYGWEVFFNDTILSDYSVAMYNSSRDSFAAAAMYMQTTNTSNRDETISINSYTDAQLSKCASLLNAADYKMWGTDTIKTRISTGNIDIGLVYSGDFFDQLYIDDYTNINYDIYIPELNNVFFDGLCIPKNADSPELAHQFIDFMIKHENAVDNAFEVGYCPTIQDVFTEVFKDEDMADIVKYDAWNPQNISNGSVYIDLKSTYTDMEKYFATVKTS